MSIWNKIWEYDSYSIPKLRQIKAKFKVNMFEPYLEITNNSICIDVGCGGGYISKELYDRYKCVVFSCDSSSTAIEYAKLKNSFENSNYFISSAENIDLPDAVADIVFCIGVLEHIPNIELSINEIQRILKSNGKFVVVSSNCYSFIFFDRIFKQIFHKWKYGYQKNWSPSGLKNKLKESGFTINHVSIYHGFGDFTALNKIDKVVAKFIPSWGRYIQIIGEKND